MAESPLERAAGGPGMGEPRAPQPAGHLGRSLEEKRPREGSRPPSPEAQPGSPPPSAGLGHLRLAGSVPRRGEGLPGPLSGQLPARPSASPAGAHVLTPPRAGLLCPPCAVPTSQHGAAGRGRLGRLTAERGGPGRGAGEMRCGRVSPNSSWTERKAIMTEVIATVSTYRAPTVGPVLSPSLIWTA